MKTSGDKLTRFQERAIAALLTCSTLPRAAQEVGVSTKTIKNWLKRPAFAEALAQARQQCLDDALGYLKGCSKDAVVTLRQCLRAGKDSDKIRSAIALLDHNMKATQLIEQEERLAAIEAALAAQQPKGN